MIKIIWKDLSVKIITLGSLFHNFISGWLTHLGGVRNRYTCVTIVTVYFSFVNLPLSCLVTLIGVLKMFHCCVKLWCRPVLHNSKQIQLLYRTLSNFCQIYGQLLKFVIRTRLIDRGAFFFVLWSSSSLGGSIDAPLSWFANRRRRRQNKEVPVPQKCRSTAVSSLLSLHIYNTYLQLHRRYQYEMGGSGKLYFFLGVLHVCSASSAGEISALKASLA